MMTIAFSVSDAPLINDARVVIYDHGMFIIQATGLHLETL